MNSDQSNNLDYDTPKKGAIIKCIELYQPSFIGTCFLNPIISFSFKGKVRNISD